MSAPEALEFDACAQAVLLREGRISASELVSAAIERIEAENPVLNAVVVPLFDRALEVVEGPLRGPFAGVPMVLKDAGQELQGTPHWVGTPVLHRLDHRSSATTALAASFQRLGFVIVGKTNLPELSAGATTEPAEFGPTRNPWDPTRTAGGSSGGSAAAVAARLVALAHGSDGTGSLRFPASACGVLTLKPSRGRVPTLAPAGQADPGGLWAEFVLTRTARDLAALFEALANPATSALPRRALRVGILTDDVATGLPTAPACAAAAEEVASALAVLGHSVERAHPAALEELFAGRVAAAFGVAGAWARGTQLRWLESRIGRPLNAGDLSDEVLELGQRGLSLAAEVVGRASEVLDQAILPVARWWDDHDLLITPAMRMPPWLLGTRSEASMVGGFAFALNFTGQPALVVPAGVTDRGLPLGVQLVGRVGEDELLVALVGELEAILGWSGRRPRPTTAC